MALALPISKDLRKLMAFGSGVGIQVVGDNLEVAAARVRPNGIQVLGRTTIANYTTRPAAEWGVEYGRFLRSMGASHVSATVLLPRRDVIVRQLSLPGVSAKDMEGAIRFQLDSLHPYGDEEIAWGWSEAGYGAVLVGVARRATVDRYHQLFTEAGVAVCNFTFSAAALHAALRLNGPLAPTGFVALSHTATGSVEVYGESPARPVYSAEFEMPAQRAAMLAASELRLPPDTEPMKLEELLPKPSANPITNDLSRNALPYATALAGACPRLAPAANVLPAEHRRYSSRAMFVPTAILGGLVLLAVAGMLLYSGYADRQYLKKIQAEIARIEPQALRASTLDRQINQTRERTLLLDQFRARTRHDLDALNELTHLIEAPAWTSSINLGRETARISGEAPQASALLRMLDDSPYFVNSAPDMIQKSPAGGESFAIRTNRENHK